MVLDRRTVALAAAVVVVAVFCLKLRAPNGEFTCIHAVDAMAPKMLIIVQHIATLLYQIETECQRPLPCASSRQDKGSRRMKIDLCSTRQNRCARPCNFQDALRQHEEHLRKHPMTLNGRMHVLAACTCCHDHPMQ